LFSQAHFTQELSKKPESERTREFKKDIFRTAMGDDSHGTVRCLGRGITPTQNCCVDASDNL